MAELPIRTHKLLTTPEGPGSRDGFRWRVWLEEDVPVIVDLGASEAVETRLGRRELHERLPDALRRLAAGRLSNDRPVLDQVTGWDSPVIVLAEHFEQRRRDA